MQMHSKKNSTQKKIATTSMDIAFHVIGGKWKMLILYTLLERPMRTGELRKKLPEISERILIRQLKELEKEQLLARQVYPTVPPKVEYQVTVYGKTLEPIIQALSAWGYNHIKKTFPGKKIVYTVKEFSGR